MDQNRFEEIRRLYSNFSDEKILECLMEGEDQYEAEAFGLLLAEAKRRSIEIPEKKVELKKEFTERKIVFTTSNFMEANLVKSLLEANSIDVYLVDGNVNRINPFYSYITGGIKLSVPVDAVESALSVLKEYLGKNGQDQNCGNNSPFKH